MSKLVSIAIPTYNRPDTLMYIINSYLTQDNIGELIIINDGSTKNYTNTIDKISSMCRHKNIKFKYFTNKEKKGAEYCRNKLKEEVEFDYILWGEDDVLLGDNYVNTLIQKKLNNPNIGAIAGRILYIDGKYYQEYPRTIQELEEKNNSKTNVYDFKLLEGYYRIKTDKDHIVPFVHAVCLMDTNFIKKYNYKDIYKINGYREESDFQLYYLLENKKNYYTSDCTCIHLNQRTGGQRQKGRLKNEYYIIKNNNRFIDENYELIVKSFPVKPKFHIKFLFVTNRISLITQSIFRKFFINK
ncbi:glycosyltransferase family 2 protein [Chengkuizengella marina]|uniref:Glycosyltransferase family 2 protein n=1 Tax=Chengkuizengella marina TaxID=2507566 RepID=A0A6N9Q3G4_9BACL|nr:glycosyltransferase family 2 protein [Chengkuizengella marina]NBI29333.1 glycosyltransferase family 2 protein [Chengkuizengella marina]